MILDLSEQVLFSPVKSNHLLLSLNILYHHSVFANILKRSVHLISAADNDINQVGKESCLIIAKISFFLLPNKQVNSVVGEICNSHRQV